MSLLYNKVAIKRFMTIQIGRLQVREEGSTAKAFLQRHWYHKKKIYWTEVIEFENLT